MSGNVWKWCRYIYDKYKKGLHINPQSFKCGTFYVNRGSGWGDMPDNFRIACRGENNQNYRKDEVGFRVVFQVDE